VTCAAAALAALAGAAAGAPPGPDSTDARAIMQAVRDRDRGDRVTGSVRMTIRDKRGDRVRTFEVRSLDFAEGSKRLMIFESPEDIRDTGLLTVDYDDGSRDDLQWLYLPAMRRATRISARTRSDSFVGSDFSFSDFTLPDPSLYELRIVEQSAEVDGQPCWLIESVPREEKTAQETGYVKTHSWISKSNLLPLRVQGWMRREGVVKYIQLADIKNVSGIWTPHRTLARTLRDGKLESETLLEQLSIAYGDASVSEQDFTERRLEQGL
jgi:hypothetical protein